MTRTRGLGWVLVGAMVLVSYGAGTAGAQTAFSEPTVPAEWKSLDVDGMTTLAEQLMAAGEGSKEDRILLGQYVAYKYLQDTSQTQAVALTRWRRLATALRVDMAEATRLYWVNRLRATYAATDAALTALPTAELAAVGEALSLLGDADIGGGVIRWAESQESLNAVSADQACGLARCVWKSGDAGKALRTRLVAHLTANCMPDAAKVRGAAVGRWSASARYLGSELGPEARTAWIAGLRTAFVGNATQLTAMKATEFAALVGVLAALGDEQAPATTVAWVAAPGDLDSATAVDLTVLTGLLSKAKAAGAASRVTAIEHLTSKRMTNSAAIRSWTTNQWRAYVEFLRSDLSEERRAQWLSKFRAAYTANQQTMSTMSGAEFTAVEQILQMLGDTQYASQVAVWAGTASEWQSWDPGKLLWLARKADAAGADGEAARRCLADHLVAKYLTGYAAAKEVNSSYWKEFTRYLLDSTTDETRAAWATGLRRSYASDPQVLASLKATDVKLIGEALRQLSVTEANRFSSAWLDVQRAGPGLSATDAATVVVPGARADVALTVPMLTQLDVQWQEQFAANKLTWTDCQNIAIAWDETGKRDKSREWGLRAYNLALGSEEARAAADYDMTASVALLLCRLGMFRDNSEYPAFAQTAGRLAREGKLPPLVRWHILCQWGKVLHRPQTRDTLKAELLDSQGVPRLQVAKLLGWAYLVAEDLPTWIAFLDSKIAAADTSDDAKAIWLLARAQAVIVTLPNEPTFLRGRPWLGKALARAQSESVRLACLQEFALHFIETKRPALGLAMLASVQSQFGESSQAALKDLKKALDSEVAVLAAQEQRRLAEQALAHKRGEINYYRVQLTEAEAQGDEERAASLRATITRLEADLAGKK